MIKKKKQAEIEVVRAKDVHVGMEYPYLPNEWSPPSSGCAHWEIHNIPFAQLPEAKPNPTLRLVKDNKVIDIHVPDMSTTDFLAHWGLRPSMRRGGYILCKRFSRLMHP